MALLAFAIYLLPEWDTAFWGAMGLSSVAALSFGVLQYRPQRRWAWWLLAGGVLACTVGDVAYGTVQDLGWNSFPSVADVFYLAMYPIMGLGLFGLTRSGVVSRDRGGLLDTLTLTAGLALLAWVLLVGPSTGVQGSNMLEDGILIAYPLADVLLLATAARLLTAPLRSPAVILLITGAGGMLSADVLYGWTVADAAYHPGAPIDLGWMALYACWGAAALHPSMVGLTEPAVPRRSEREPRGLALLAFSALVAPVVLFVEAAMGRSRDDLVVAGLVTAMFLLVLGRLADAASTLRRVVARGRSLREASAELLSATDPDEVTAAVRSVVARMMPPDTPHRVVFQQGRASTGPARMVRIEDLERTAGLAEELAGFEFAVLCPIVLTRRSTECPKQSALLVAADATALVVVGDYLDVLTSQVALALERIALSHEVNRRTSEEYFRTLVQNTADVILIVDADDRIRYASPSADGVFGREQLTGIALRELVHADGPEATPCHAVGLIGHQPGPGDWAGWIVWRPDGSRVEVEATCRDLREDRTVGGLVVTLRDVTEQRRLARELTRQAFHDSLTGLANRALFTDRVEQAVARSMNSAATVGVLFIDLDDFKVVNDTMGHPTGDALLVAVGQRLSAALGPGDTAARLGGDEFAALTEEASHPREVEQIAERVVSALAEPFRLGEHVVSGAASVGVATSTPTTDAQELLRRADLALYVAKGAGKGQWRRYKPALHTALAQRLQLRAALDQAVADRAFTLEYQPIMAMATGVTVGFEALVRWAHPARGLVPPDQFIEVAEETGLIEPIGDWVMEHALSVAARWYRELAAPAPPYISINVSARQFRATGFVTKVRRALTSTGLPPRLLLLEITESLLLRDDERVWKDLSVLREVGVRTAIDDFGTGFSSLSYLRQTPIDVLKIDRSFTDTVASSDRQRALVDGILRLARTLGLQVIAEGIETQTDRDLLTDIGCPYGQGYLFSRPLSHDDAVRWLRTEQGAPLPPTPLASP